MHNFPGRLHHKTPPWVEDRAIFHIRIRASTAQTRPLTNPDLAKPLLDSVAFYHRQQKWSCYLIVVLPDHLHGLFSFGRTSGMARVIADWKRFHHRHTGIIWQDNFFDHRIRNAASFAETYAYIERNPVALELCASPDDWPYRGQALSQDSGPVSFT